MALSLRAQAEAVEQFGDDLAALAFAFDRLCRHLSPSVVDRVNEIPNQDQLEAIAKGFRTLGDQLCRECDAAEEADDRRRSNPLEHDFRRIG